MAATLFTNLQRLSLLWLPWCSTSTDSNVSRNSSNIQIVLAGLALLYLYSISAYSLLLGLIQIHGRFRVVYDFVS